jgi:hypothetical protein
MSEGDPGAADEALGTEVVKFKVSAVGIDLGLGELLERALDAPLAEVGWAVMARSSASSM